MKRAKCVVLIAFGAGTLVAATPQELVRESLANYQRDRVEAVAHYTYVERDTDDNGDSKSVEIDKEMLVNQIPYEVAQMRDSKPLTASEQAKEQEKLEKRRNESPSAKEKRLRDYRASQQFLNEVPEAFEFKLLGQETIDGRENYVIECTPKAGYRPQNSKAAMFSHIEAKLWIDRDDLQWRRAEAKVLDTISIGWIVARIGPGAHMTMEQKRLNDRDWLPSLITVDGDAKVFLVKNHPIHEHMEFYDFKPIAPAESDLSPLTKAPHKRVGETSDSAVTSR